MPLSIKYENAENNKLIHLLINKLQFLIECKDKK